MAPTSKYNAVPLEKAPYLFFDKLEEILLPSESQHISNGWKAIARLPELEIESQKVREIEKTGQCVPNFLRYLVFEHPQKNELTVQKMEEFARKIHNIRIVREFAEIKRKLQQRNEDSTPTAADLYRKSSLQVFGMLSYRAASRVARCPALYSLVMVVLFFRFFQCIFLVNELEKPFLNPLTMHFKLGLLLIARWWVHCFFPLVFAHKLFGHQIITIPEEIQNHKLLRLLKSHPEYLRALHKDHSLPGETATSQQQSNIVQYTLTTLYKKLKWLTLAAVIYSIFLPTFLYKAGGMGYQHLSAEWCTPLMLWDILSTFVDLLIINITYVFFVYEYRLIKYVSSLISKGPEVEDIARDFHEKIAQRWQWLLWCNLFTSILLIVLVTAHWYIDSPLTASCMPFSASFTPLHWFLSILLLSIITLLTFVSIENMLRPIKKAVCVLCTALLLVWIPGFEGLLGTDMIHFHVLLYHIPLIFCLCTCWTFAESHYKASKYQKGDGNHTIFFLVNLLLLASLVCVTGVSGWKEYLFIHNNHNSPLPFCNVSNIPGTVTVSFPNELHLQTDHNYHPDCSKLQHTPSQSDSNSPNMVSVIMTLPPLPPHCQFYQGQYSLRLQHLGRFGNVIFAHLTYHAIYHYRTLFPCMCPHSGQFVVIYRSSKPLDLKTLSEECANTNFQLQQKYPWTDVFNLITLMCINQESQSHR